MKFYVVDLINGSIAEENAKSDLDLEITLMNGDCVKTKEEAEELSYKVKNEIV